MTRRLTQAPHDNLSQIGATPSRGPHRCARRRPLLRLLILFLPLSLGLPACQGDTPPPPAEAPVPFEPFYGLNLAQARQEMRALGESLIAEGYQCGWDTAHAQALEEDLESRPAAFRARTREASSTLAPYAFVLGALLVLTFGLLGPRWRRRNRHRLETAPWLSRLGALLNPWLPVDAFDPFVAKKREDLRAACLETDRLIRLTQQRLLHAPGEPAPPPQALEDWRIELHDLGAKLAQPGLLPLHFSPDILAPWVDASLRAATQLREEAERALHAGQTPPLTLLELRPRLGRPPKAPRPTMAAPTWARPLGWLGLACLLAAFPFAAAWMAAGAAPLLVPLGLLIIAFLTLGLSSLLLSRSEQGPLFPQATAPVLRWTLLGAGLVTLVLITSASFQPESGLNLGAPPPTQLPMPQKAPLDPLPSPGTLGPQTDSPPTP